MQMKERGCERIEFLGPEEETLRSLVDLSATGVAFIHPAELKKDLLVSVKIKEFVLPAIVVYCQPRVKGYRLGLQFKSVSPDMQNKLKTLVEEFSRGVPIACEIVKDDKKKE
jgi:hypothetical protein